MFPRRRKPSPTGKVDRAQPGPDEGKQPKSEKQATLNGSVFHSTWPVSLLGCGPSSVTPYGVPPSPWGKATSRRGLSYPLPGEGGPAKPGRVWGGTEPTARRSLSQPGADSSLYAREPAPHLPLRRHLPPRGRSRAFTSRRRRERCFPRHSLPDPGPWPDSSRWVPWPPGLWTSPGSCGPGT